MNFFATHGLSVSTPSMVILPALNVVKTHQEIDHGGLPAPVGPTIATFYPGFASAVKSWIIVLYLVNSQNEHAQI